MHLLRLENSLFSVLRSKDSGTTTYLNKLKSDFVNCQICQQLWSKMSTNPWNVPYAFYLWFRNNKFHFRVTLFACIAYYMTAQTFCFWYRGIERRKKTSTTTTTHFYYTLAKPFETWVFIQEAIANFQKERHHKI